MKSNKLIKYAYLCTHIRCKRERKPLARRMLCPIFKKSDNEEKINIK